MNDCPEEETATVNIWRIIITLNYYNFQKAAIDNIFRDISDFIFSTLRVHFSKKKKKSLNKFHRPRVVGNENKRNNPFILLSICSNISPQIILRMYVNLYYHNNIMLI